MTMREGAAIYAPGGALLAEGDLLAQPGLVQALELVRDEGAALGLHRLDRERAPRADRRARRIDHRRPTSRPTRPSGRSPSTARFAGRRVRTRAGLSGLPETLARFDPAGGADALLEALEHEATIDGHTTNITVVDGAGNACVLTSSLGLGSGDWLPGLDLHLNSMLGETDLIRAPLSPGARMASMMAPTLVFDGDELELGIGAAGGTRLRTALVGVLAAVLHEGVAPQPAIDRPRFHPDGHVLNAEPGVDEAWLARLEARGREVRRFAGTAPLLRRRQCGRAHGRRRRSAPERRGRLRLAAAVRRAAPPLSSPRRRGRSARRARPRSRRRARRGAAATARPRAGRRRGRPVQSSRYASMRRSVPP